MFRHLARLAFAAAFVLGVGAPAGAVAPFDFDTTPGRLPKTVVPTAYRIAIIPDAQAKTLRGTEQVALDVRRATDRIVFNTHELTIGGARFDGAPVAQVRTENAKQLTTLTLAHPAAVGRHVLALSFAGKIEDSPDGLFAQDYRTPDGRSGRMLSTQFESTDARRVFPSWDEPAFRATFQLTVTLPAAWAAVSNMPVASRAVHGALATTTFGRTPKMPSYLVVLAAGELGSISGTGPNGVKQSVWAIKGDEQDGRYALESAYKILAYYDDYFGVKYPLPKLDHIAIPGGFGGAMENWGGITYNEDIIIHRRNATLDDKQKGFSIVAHEMAHQWNGDLVTMGWWDDIWLNESFASWMAAKATDKFNPAWNWAQSEDKSKQRAMNADARASSHPIQQHVVDELQADASFDPEITYNKGQAFLRMLEAYLGPDTFRGGIRTYMRAHKYSNATTADLWIALGAASKKDVSALAKAWTEQPGFPLVSVTAACDGAGNRTVTLAQQRFLLDGTTDAAHLRWNVPVSLASGNAAPAYVMLRDAQHGGIAAGRCAEPLRVNAGGVGYYRVAYDAPTFAANRAAFASLPDADKIAMLGDQWSLVRVGRAALPAYLALANGMGTNRNARAWQDIVDALTELEKGARGTAEHDAISAYARTVVTPLVTSLGWDAKPGETVATGELRRAALAALGAWADPAVVAEARTRFERAAADPATAPDILTTLIGIVATNADTQTFDRLHQLAQTAKDTTLAARYRAALMKVRDPQLAARALDIALSSEIPPQQSSARFRYVIAAADWNPKLAWPFFQAHGDVLTRRFSQFEKILNLADTVPGAFWDAATPQQLEAWLKANLPPNAAPYVAKGMARAKADGAIRERLREDGRAFLAAGGASRT